MDFSISLYSRWNYEKKNIVQCLFWGHRPIRVSLPTGNACENETVMWLRQWFILQWNSNRTKITNDKETNWPTKTNHSWKNNNSMKKHGNENMIPEKRERKKIDARIWKRKIWFLKEREKNIRCQKMKIKIWLSNSL